MTSLILSLSLTLLCGLAFPPSEIILPMKQKLIPNIFHHKTFLKHIPIMASQENVISAPNLTIIVVVSALERPPLSNSCSKRSSKSLSWYQPTDWEGPFVKMRHLIHQFNLDKNVTILHGLKNRIEPII